MQRMPTSVAGAGQTTEFNYSASVRVEGSDRGSPNQNILPQLGKLIDTRIKETIQREQRPGGMLNG